MYSWYILLETQRPSASVLLFFVVVTSADRFLRHTSAVARACCFYVIFSSCLGFRDAFLRFVRTQKLVRATLIGLLLLERSDTAHGFVIPPVGE